jgi:hypothetical protein
MPEQLAPVSPSIALRTGSPVGALIRDAGESWQQSSAGESALPVVLLTIAFHAALLAIPAWQHGDPAILMCVGEGRKALDAFREIHVYGGEFGYDGQFCYALAQAEPWAQHDAEIDCAAPRQLRILYPALAWVITRGDPQALLWAMPLINVLAIAALAWLGSSLARRSGLSPWWGFLLPLAVNVGMPALRNLTDVLSTAAVCAVLVFWLQERYGWPLLLAALAAVFTRETNVVVVGLVLAACVWQRRKKLAVGLSLVLVLWACWVGYLWRLYNHHPFLPAEGNFAVPGTGLLFGWQHAAEAGGLRSVGGFLSLGFLTLQLALVPYVVRQKVNTVVLAVLLAGAALALTGGPFLYIDRWSYSRVFAWLPLALCLACLEVRKPWPVLLLALAAGLPVVSALRA